MIDHHTKIKGGEYHEKKGRFIMQFTVAIDIRRTGYSIHCIRVTPVLAEKLQVGAVPEEGCKGRGDYCGVATTT